MILYKYGGQESKSLSTVRKWFPNKSLPVNLTEEVLFYLGVAVEEVPDEVIPEPTLDEIKEQKCAEIRSLSDSFVAKIREGYTVGEVETFAQQYSGAKSILEGNPAYMGNALFVVGLLSNRLGRVPTESEIKEFAERIKANYDRAKEGIITIVGTQQRLELAARGALTKEEVSAIEWPMQ